LFRNFDSFADFVCVHNGIVTNYKDIKQYLTSKGFTFESETDTEAIVKLVQHIHNRHPSLQFRQLVETAVQQLVRAHACFDAFTCMCMQEGAFALVFKSRLFPGQLVATRRGSPLLVGIHSLTRLSTDRFPVYYSKGVFMSFVVRVKGEERTVMSKGYH
jgi:glucosamine--fructose-6-phosphate aminotransferase (isomerizing)